MKYNRKTFSVKTSPSLYPISLSELKSFLKIDDNNEDSVLMTIIEGCVDNAQKYCRSFFINHTIVMTLDRFPNSSYDYDLNLGQGVHEGYRGYFQGDSFINLPFSPISSIISLKTYDEDNVEATLNASKYRLDQQGARLYLNRGEVWPTDLRDYESVKVEYVSGYGASPSNVPAGIRLALLSYCTHAYECRGDCTMTDEIQSKFDQFRNHEGLALLS